MPTVVFPSCPIRELIKNLLLLAHLVLLVIDSFSASAPSQFPRLPLQSPVMARSAAGLLLPTFGSNTDTPGGQQ